MVSHWISQVFEHYLLILSQESGEEVFVIKTIHINFWSNFNLWNLCLCFKCKYTKVFVCKESYIALLISEAVTGAEFLLWGFGLNKFQQITFKYLFQVNLNKCK